MPGLAGVPSALGLTMAEFAVGGDAVCASFERGVVGGIAEVGGDAVCVSLVWEMLAKMPGLAGCRVHLF